MPACTARGRIAAWVSPSSAIGTGSGVTHVASLPAAASSSPRPIACACPTASSSTIRSPERVGVGRARAAARRRGRAPSPARDPGTGIGWYAAWPSFVARPPVATITASGESASTSSAVASTPSRTSTPRRSHSPMRQSAISQISSRPGSSRAQRRCAAELGRSRSRSVTSWPRAAAVAAASMPTRAAADHDDPLGRRGGLERAEPEIVLPTDGRVLHAVDRHRLEQVAVARLVDPGAAADLVVAALPRLVAPTRGRRSSARTSVMPSASWLLDDLLGLVGREDAVHGEDGRVAHGLLDRVRRVHAEAVRRVVGAHHADAADADAHVEVVDEPELLVAGGDLGAVVGGEPGAVRLLVVADEAEPDGDLVADGLAHRRHDLARRSASGSRGLPPYSSVRWLNFGERNWWSRYPCALWISMPSNPPATALRAHRTW